MKIKGYTIRPNADLRGTDLRNANLRGADLQGADFRGAYLQGADLVDANLRNADLRGADLRGTDLQGANLRGADLVDANLRNADLRNADLRGAYLQGADLRGAYLQGADLRNAHLRDADLRGANLRNADLRGADLPRFQIPQTGTLEVFKKLRGGIVAKLLIPATAKRTATPIGRKCRAEYAEVLSLSDGFVEGMSMHDSNYQYIVGKTIRPSAYNPDIRLECTEGIHFFLTEEEAREYN